jgi:ParB family chromosome partitioning protein
VLVPLSATDAERLATRIIKEGLSVREAEKLAKKRGESDDEEEEKQETGGSRYRDDAQTRQITNKLQRALGTKVKLKDRDGKGKVEIHYEDYEILQSVLDRIVED